MLDVRLVRKATTEYRRADWRSRIESVVFSRPAGVFAGIALALIILGCMSIQIGGKNFHEGAAEDGSFQQCGEVRLAAGEMRVVYYPIPYAQPPNLEIDNLCNTCELLVQNADHFQIRNPALTSRTVDWRARGVKACPPAATPPAPAAPAP